MHLGPTGALGRAGGSLGDTFVAKQYANFTRLGGNATWYMFCGFGT
jgi:hypothetical protein